MASGNCAMGFGTCCIFLSNSCGDEVKKSFIGSFSSYLIDFSVLIRTHPVHNKTKQLIDFSLHDRSTKMWRMWGMKISRQPFPEPVWRIVPTLSRSVVTTYVALGAEQFHFPSFSPTTTNECFLCRLDFEQFTLLGASGTDDLTASQACVDSFTVTGLSTGSSVVPTICGANNGQHSKWLK